MHQIRNITDVNFEDIKVDDFWNTGNESEDKFHRIHAYPAKFPAFITQKAIQFAKEEGVIVNRIADIFCGCGTVAFEAKRLGIKFWGCDLNPVAVLIAKTKSNTYKEKTVSCYYQKIIDLFDSNYHDNSLQVVANKRIEYWYFSQEIIDLTLLKQCIFDIIPYNSKYRNFFLCAFSNILKPTSKWLTKSIKPQIDPIKKPVKVRDAFIKQYDFMRKAIDSELKTTPSSVIIELKNALKIKKRNFVDLIISSPPYVTSYEYADLHQLSTLWLNYADDYRVLRRDSIGSYHNKILCENDLNALNDSGRHIVEQLSCAEKAKARAVAKYYLDIQSAVNVCRSVLTKTGMLVMVIGNTEYKGVYINNAKHLVEAMLCSGFNTVKITKRKISGKILTPYRDEHGRFSINDKQRQVYSEEFIVIGR